MMVENGEVKAISNAELDKQNYAIQPTQSFFVKKKEGETVENVRFTSTMYVDRTITPGLLMASDYVKSIEATTENSNGQISKARIALRPELLPTMMTRRMWISCMIRTSRMFRRFIP